MLVKIEQKGKEILENKHILDFEDSSISVSELYFDTEIEEFCFIGVCKYTDEEEEEKEENIWGRVISPILGEIGKDEFFILYEGDYISYDLLHHHETEIEFDFWSPEIKLVNFWEWDYTPKEKLLDPEKLWDKLLGIEY